jgi:ribonucleotide reductase beta subunit family protein with ferritin-like domain
MSSNIVPVFPVRNNELFDYYKKAINSFWILEEIDYSKDKYQWKNDLNDDERFFISRILAFFAQSDRIVNINLEERFLKDIKTLPDDMIVPVEFFYNFQKAVEDIHSQTYEFMLSLYINDDKSILHDGIKNIPAIKKKADWAFKWIDDTDSSFASRLVAFAALEGIFFSGSFCAIYWIQGKNILSGLTKSNEFISRDEGLHRDFACTLYKKLELMGQGIPHEQIQNIIKEAVAIEKEFIIDSLPCRLLGINSDSMSQYIELVADNLLSMLGVENIYNTTNPFPFMTLISLTVKTNFFESRDTVYSRGLHDGKDIDLDDMDF